MWIYSITLSSEAGLWPSKAGGGREVVEAHEHVLYMGMKLREPEEHKGQEGTPGFEPGTC